ncbi:MAG: hypothetical protein PHV85_04610 [Desulfovibrionaceae bacterium]|nr:hypothetical protein [Desulfovibrionaceae bacterium]
MAQPTPEKIEELKRLMYEKLSPRQRRFVDRIGYQNWDPFQLPNDPIDIRTEATGYTSRQLTSLFMQDRGGKPDPNYQQAVSEFCLLLVGNKEKVRPVFEFCQWYGRLLEKSGKKL